LCPRVAIFLLLSIVAAVVLLGAFGVSERNLRLLGVAYELLGVGAVAMGVRDIRKLFNRPSVLESIRIWLNDRPHLKTEVKIISGSVHMSLGGVSAVAQATLKVAPDATTEVRVAALERNLEALAGAVGDLRAKQGQDALRQEAALTNETRQREQGDVETKRLLEIAMAGGLALETCGVVWLVLGVIMTNATPESLSLLRFVGLA
jgi:hypothetical protein